MVSLVRRPCWEWAYWNVHHTNDSCLFSRRFFSRFSTRHVHTGLGPKGVDVLLCDAPEKQTVTESFPGAECQATGKFAARHASVISSYHAGSCLGPPPELDAHESCLGYPQAWNNHAWAPLGMNRTVSPGMKYSCLGYPQVGNTPSLDKDRPSLRKIGVSLDKDRSSLD